MHDPGKHSSPVRLPFGSFPVINILLSHTDYLLQTNRAACTLFLLLSCVACKLCKPGKYQTMIVNRITSWNADHVYTVFFQRTFFLSGYFCRNGKKNVSLFCDKLRKFYLSFSRAGIPVIPAFFIPGKSVCRALASSGGLVNVCLSFTVTKVVLFSVYANTWYYFLYSFNRYLLFKLKRKVYLHLPRFLVSFLTM